MNRTVRVFTGVLLFAAAAAPLSAQRAGAVAPPPGLDAFVDSVMRHFEVPGIALAIVKDGQVVVAKGYGVRELGKPDRVDEYTLFGIASNTKAFTATALGLLVEEGKIRWDDRVVDHLPSFQMWDPYVTRELTIRDLLVHRSGLGLGAGDLLWWPASTYDRKEIVRRLRYIRPATSFRSAYAYDNVLYLVAGEVIEAVTGQTWEEFVATRILAPVGMNASNVRHSGAAMGGNVATPHARIRGTVRPVAPHVSDNTNPAGGINSGAADMAKWLVVQLDSGRIGERRLFSARTARELWTPVTPQPIGEPPAEVAPIRANFRGYALGFEVMDYRGRKLVRHSGGLPGYVSRLVMIPDEKLGVVVLTNQESGAAFDAIAYHVLDHYLGVPRFDWLGGFARLMERQDSIIAAMEQRTASERARNSRPSLPLAAYAGTYTDEWYGDVEISLEGNRLAIRFTRTPALTGVLEHWQYDTFIARWSDPELRADAFVTFALDPEGRIDQVKMRAVSPATDFSFDFHDLLLRPAKRPAL